MRGGAVLHGLLALSNVVFLVAVLLETRRALRSSRDSTGGNAFPAALSLYSTTNGLFTIGQQLLINRMKDEEEPATPAAPTGGKPVKNVTPKKK